MWPPYGKHSDFGDNYRKSVSGHNGSSLAGVVTHLPRCHSKALRSQTAPEAFRHCSVISLCMRRAQLAFGSTDCTDLSV